MKSFLKKIIATLLLTTFFTTPVLGSESNYVPKKNEFRAAWVATVGNIDFPSKKGLSAEEQKAEFIAIVDKAKAMNLNALIIQIRPTADAFYKSEMNPWSEFLTGTEGQSPGYDPLEFMTDECHKRNIELHAWLNPFRVSNNNSTKVYSENNIANTNPNWMVDYRGKKYIDPGIDEARKYVIDSIMEVVKNYDIDAIHFDDYFYPYPSTEEFPDNKSFQKYNRGFKDKNAWRRDNVNLFMKDVYTQIKAEKDYVQLGVSPFGVWRNKSTDPTGSNTTASVSCYDSLHADTRTWIENNWLDYIMPQIYWNFSLKAAPYAEVLKFWVKEVHKNPNVKLYVGHGAHKINSWKQSNELQKQLEFNNHYLEVSGSAFYSVTPINKNPRGIVDSLKNVYYKYPALIPSTSSFNNGFNDTVKVLSKELTNNSAKITFSLENEMVKSFVIYKSETAQVPDINNSANIVEIINKNSESEFVFTDSNLQSKNTYTYVITAIDRYNNESKISDIITFIVR